MVFNRMGDRTRRHRYGDDIMIASTNHLAPQGSIIDD
ncbi:hypothetical protein SPLC1_S500590 [Arthrospira platensis C1]|nr:hypothetical protein SPLC1_S500590 [Arthrospira platensis C1]